MRRLTIVGRNLLLQPIYYSSCPFYLYFMILPRAVIRLMDQDAKHVLWATDPHLYSTEAGTSSKCRRWIHERASYLPVAKGGAGVTHWASHCEAYYAEWIVRYLHPRRAPWKTLLRHWIDEEFLHEGILVLHAHGSDRSNQLPYTATYMKRCLRT